MFYQLRQQSLQDPYCQTVNVREGILQVSSKEKSHHLLVVDRSGKRWRQWDITRNMNAASHVLTSCLGTNHLDFRVQTQTQHTSSQTRPPTFPQRRLLPQTRQITSCGLESSDWQSLCQRNCEESCRRC